MSDTQIEILELATAYFTENPHAVLAQFVKEVHLSESDAIDAAKTAPTKYAFAAHQILTTGRSVSLRLSAEKRQAQPINNGIHTYRRHEADRMDQQLAKQLTEMLTQHPNMTYREVAVELRRSYWEVCQTARKLGLVSCCSVRSSTELAHLDELVKAEWDKDNNQSIRGVAFALSLPYNAVRDAYIRMGLQNNLTAKRAFEREVVEYCGANPLATTREVAAHFKRSLSTVYKIMGRHNLLTPERTGRYATAKCRLPKIGDEDIKTWVSSHPSGTIRDAMAFFKCGRMAVVDALSRNGLKIQRQALVEESIYNQKGREEETSERTSGQVANHLPAVSAPLLLCAESMDDLASFAAACGLGLDHADDLEDAVQKKIDRIDRLLHAVTNRRDKLRALANALEIKKRTESARAQVIQAIQQGDAQMLTRILSVLNQQG